MTYYVLLVLALALPLSCATGLAVGRSSDRLVQPTDLPGGEWFRMESAAGDLHRTTWMSESGQSIAMAVTLYGNSPDTDQFRKADDERNAAVCKEFESETVEAHDSVHFPTVTWRTRCIYPDGSGYPGDLEQIVVQRVIRSESAVYSIKRIWNRPVSEREVLDWLLYLQRVYVCNVHEDRVPCDSSGRD